MDVNNFHIRHFKLYNSSYGDGTQLGKYMQQAQDQHFKNEGMGCAVPSGVMTAVLSKYVREEHINGTEDTGGVVLGQNTTDEDWNAAQFVVVKSKKDGCTWKDLSNHLSGLSTGSPAKFQTYRDNQNMLSPIAARLQKEVDEAHCKEIKTSSVELSFQDDDDSLEMQLHTLRKTAVGAIDDIVKCDEIPTEVKERFVSQIQEMKMSMLKEYTSKRNDSGTTFEFPVTEIAKGKKEEKRKRNVLG